MSIFKTPTETGQGTISVEILRSNSESLERYLADQHGAAAVPGELRELVAVVKSLDPQIRVPISEVHQHVKRAAETMGLPNLGLLVASHTMPEKILPFKLIMDGSYEFIDLLHMLERYCALTTEIVETEIEFTDKYIVFHLSTVDENHVTYHQVEGLCLILLKIIFYCSAELVAKVNFSHEKPEGTEQTYLDILGVLPKFSQEKNSLFFPKSLLHKSVGKISVDEKVEAINFLESRRQKLITDAESEETMVGRTEFLLKQVLSLGEPHRKEIAAMLNLTVRTFQRRLEKENTNFNELLQNFRQRLAKKYLKENDFSCNEIAFLLGYKDTSQFYKSFKQWFGMAPAEYREQLQNEPPD